MDGYHFIKKKRNEKSGCCHFVSFRLSVLKFMRAWFVSLCCNKTYFLIKITSIHDGCCCCRCHFYFLPIRLAILGSCFLLYAANDIDIELQVFLYENDINL